MPASTQNASSRGTRASTVSTAGLRVVDPQQAHHERVGAEAAVPDADPVLGRQDGGEQVVGDASQVEGQEPHARMLGGPDAVVLERLDAAEALASVAEQR